MAPNITIDVKRLPSRKKVKQRSFVFPCANGYGSKIFDLTIIGSSVILRGFSFFIKRVKKRSLTITQTRKHGWQRSFSTQGCRGSIHTMENHERKAALLVDNWSAHGTADTLIDLNNVEMLFFLLETAPKIQPIDVAVIASIKFRYTVAQMKRGIDLAHKTLSVIYKIDILSAMYAL